MEGPGEAALIRDQLANAIGRDRFDLWLSDDAKLLVDDGKSIEVVFSSAFLCDTARRNLGSELTAAAQRLYGPGKQVRFRVDERDDQQQPVLPIAQQRTDSAARVAPANHTPPPAKPTSPSKPTGGTFAGLVVGRANELAARAARQLAEGATVGGPLTIWGPPGTGKTHLLSAIKHAYRHKFRRSRVLSLTAEQFVSSYVEALRGSGLPSFRQKVRGANLLLLDDLHFMAGKRATLEELQHTVDQVVSSGGQIVFASCADPGQITNFPHEMLSRVRAGLVCEVATADHATRLEVARRRCDEYGLPIEQLALERLAAGVSSGVRELFGAIERLRARHELLGEAITPDLVDQTTSEINYQTIRRVAMADIQRVVCDHFGIEGTALRSSSRHKSVTEPRMLAMWLARKYTQAGWREIGEYFGGRRHSTVISAHRRIEAQRGRDTTVCRGTGAANLEDTLGQIETKLRLA